MSAFALSKMPRAKESVLLGLRPQLSWTISFFGRDRNDFYARNAFFAASGALATFTTPEKSIAPKKPVPKGRQAPKVSERSDQAPSWEGVWGWVFGGKAPHRTRLGGGADTGRFGGVRPSNNNEADAPQMKKDGRKAIFFHLGCDVGLEPTTPRTTIWCSTN